MQWGFSRILWAVFAGFTSFETYQRQFLPYAWSDLTPGFSGKRPCVVIVEPVLITPWQAPVNREVVQTEEGVFYDVEIGGVVEVLGGDQSGIALKESQTSVFIPVNKGQNGKIDLIERGCQHGGADGPGRWSGIVLEQAGTPVSGQDGPRQEKAGQIQHMAHVIIKAQVLDGVCHHLMGIFGLESAWTTDTQMVPAVLGDRHDDGANTQKGFNQQLFRQIAVVTHPNSLLQFWVPDVVDATNIQGRVGPVALSNGFDDLADPAPTLNQ